MTQEVIPTPEQEAITSAVLSGQNIMVEALAGCAKSTTIEMAVRALPKARRILVLAFNRKIKSDMEKRLKDVPNVKVQTANGFGLAALYRSNIRGPLDQDKIFKLSKAVGVRGDDLSDLMSLVRSARMAGVFPSGLAGKGLIPDTMDTWQAIAADETIDPVWITPAQEILNKSTRMALRGEALDFDDQIYLSALSCGSFPSYDTIFVDEAQDLAPLNHAQIRRASRSAQLVVVGDTHQAIYAWRGADCHSMRNIRNLRPAWTDLTLSVTFRCPSRVVERLQAFVPRFQAGPSNREGHIEQLSRWTPQPASAIISRNNAPIIKTAFRLLRRGIPAQVIGTDIGKNLKRLYNKLSDHGRLSHEKVMEKARLQLSSCPAKEVDRLESLLALLEGAGRSGNVSSAVEALTAAAGRDSISLSTGHRAKGLEWPTVYHLEPQLIPSCYAHTPEELQQEENLRYVIETRTQNALYFVRQEGLQ